jgi:hypothetical protein
LPNSSTLKNHPTATVHPARPPDVEAAYARILQEVDFYGGEHDDDFVNDLKIVLDDYKRLRQQP